MEKRGSQLACRHFSPKARVVDSKSPLICNETELLQTMTFHAPTLRISPNPLFHLLPRYLCSLCLSPIPFLVRNDFTATGERRECLHYFKETNRLVGKGCLILSGDSTEVQLRRIIEIIFLSCFYNVNYVNAYIVANIT